MNLRKAFVSAAAIVMAGILPFSAFQKTLLAGSDINDRSGKEIRIGTGAVIAVAACVAVVFAVRKKKHA